MRDLRVDVVIIGDGLGERFEQHGCGAFRVVRDVERPVHYKFHQPVDIRVTRDEPLFHSEP